VVHSCKHHVIQLILLIGVRLQTGSVWWTFTGLHGFTE
jgi:hypothetical protein